MYYMEQQELQECEALAFIQEAVHDPENNELRELIIDPIITKLEEKTVRKNYIDMGKLFIEANAEMLAKEYPTKSVSYPRRYVDEVMNMFGFTTATLKDVVRKLIKHVNEKSSFQTIVENPTNIIHTTVLFYSDMILNKELRDSARQQLGLSIYAKIFNRYFPSYLNENVMSYTYSQLDNSWNLVKEENVVNWIGGTVETSYAFYKTRLSVDMSMNTLVQFLNRTRNSFNQNFHGLSNRYYDNLDNGNLVGADDSGEGENLVTTNFTVLKNNLMQLIRGHDGLYYTNGDLYTSIAKLKNVKSEELYEFAMRIGFSDIDSIINNILYVFLIKEGFAIADINSTKYISRITNFPTAIDRAIQGKPVILPLVQKYNVSANIAKAYICLIAFYILRQVNTITHQKGIE